MIKQLRFCIVVIPAIAATLFSQGKFTPDDYKRALWMTTRFYGAQRSGTGPNWLIMQHDTVKYRTCFTKDADGSRDLSGGWVDCGDHVTFGQTFFYSTYILAKAYDLFPLGFHDMYNGLDYSDYVASGSWDIDGGAPNGIPDLIEELRYATDWIMKAAPDGSTFYYQKGEGMKDHKLWVTAGMMSAQPPELGGEPRKIFKNPNDGVMAALASGTLAIMSRIYRKYDEVYADKCLEYAKNAYAYAKSHKGQAAAAGDGGFYGAHAPPPVVAFITAASEMFAATGDNTYKSDATAEQGSIKFHNYGLDYSNTHDLAPLAMATSRVDTSKINQLKTMFVDQYANSLNSEGVCTKGNSGWGALRYPGNHAFIVAAYLQTKKDTSLNSFVYKQADYIMGANNAKQSFIVGFCSGCTKQVRMPHHRNVYLRDDNPKDSAKALMTIPLRNEQFGYLVGGTFSSSSYKESVTDFAMTEGGIDYNAGLVGALGYIVSRLAPADTSRMVGVVYRKGRRPHADGIGVQRIGGDWRITSVNSAPIVDVMVVDFRGRTVFSAQPRTSAIILQNILFGRGMYTIRVRTIDGQNIVRQFCTVR